MSLCRAHVAVQLEFGRRSNRSRVRKVDNGGRSTKDFCSGTDPWFHCAQGATFFFLASHGLAVCGNHRLVQGFLPKVQELRDLMRASCRLWWCVCAWNERQGSCEDRFRPCGYDMILSFHLFSVGPGALLLYVCEVHSDWRERGHRAWPPFC